MEKKILLIEPPFLRLYKESYSLDRETFRSKVAAVERYIDRKNRINRIKRLFSSNLFWRIREKGIVGSLREVPKILLGK